MTELTVLGSTLAGLVGGWLVLVLVDRIPVARRLFRPFPAIPFPRGLSVADGSVYPLTVGVFVLAALRFDGDIQLALYLAFFTVLIALSIIDIETLRLPDRLTLPSSAASLLLIAAISAIEGDAGAVVTALTGGAVYFGVLLLAHLAHPAGMGFGDVKLALLMGLYVGWPAPDALGAVVVVIWTMLVGFALGSVVGVAVMIFRGRSSPYPFGPFLALGTAIVVLAGPDFLPKAVAEQFRF